MSKCWYVTLIMIVSGVLDWCYRQAKSHHRNRQAFNSRQPWKFGELICVSHIVPLISVTRMMAVSGPPAVSVCAKKILRSVRCACVLRPSQNTKRRIIYSSLLISQLPTKMKQLYAHNHHFKICHYLKFTKKGKWKQNVQLTLCSHHCSHWLTVTDENCPDCSQKANWHFIRSDWGSYLVWCPFLFFTGCGLLWRLSLLLLSFKRWNETKHI